MLVSRRRVYDCPGAIRKDLEAEELRALRCSDKAVDGMNAAQVQLMPSAVSEGWLRTSSQPP